MKRAVKWLEASNNGSGTASANGTDCRKIRGSDPEPEPEPELEPQLSLRLSLSLSLSLSHRRASAVRSAARFTTANWLRIALITSCRLSMSTSRPFSEATAGSTLSNTPWLWILVFVTVSIAAFAGYFVTSQLTAGVAPDAHSTGARQEPRSFLKASPVASGELAGKSVKLLEAECPVYENDARPAGASKTVNVRIKLDKNGRVYWARAEAATKPCATPPPKPPPAPPSHPTDFVDAKQKEPLLHNFTP